MTVGENIKRIRNEKAMTQKELGEKLGVSQIRVAQYENGNRAPKLETIDKIAKVLEVSLVSIVDDFELTEKARASDFTSWIKKDLFHEIEVVIRVMSSPELLPVTVNKEVARMEGKLSMAYMCDVITLEEKKELHGKLQELVKEERR